MLLTTTAFSPNGELHEYGVQQYSTTPDLLMASAAIVWRTTYSIHDDTGARIGSDSFREQTAVMLHLL